MNKPRDKAFVDKNNNITQRLTICVCTHNYANESLILK